MEQATHIIAMEFLWNFMAFLMNITFVFYNKSYSKKKKQLTKQMPIHWVFVEHGKCLMESGQF